MCGGCDWRDTLGVEAESVGYVEGLNLPGILAGWLSLCLLVVSVICVCLLKGRWVACPEDVVWSGCHLNSNNPTLKRGEK